MEVLPVGPRADEVRVGDQNARRVLVRAEDGDGLPRLDEQRLVVLQRGEFAHDGVERVPVARRLAAPAVDDEVVGALGHFRVEVVHQAAQGRLLMPALAVKLGATRRADISRSAHSLTP
jgi:hypothetical protein